MSTHGLEHLGLFLLIGVTFFAGMARRLGVPYPILLVLGGLGLSFVPHVPRVPLNPDLVFFVFLPPLLYAAAWQTNWREFSQNIVSISMLATGLVGFTVFGVALFADHMIRALDFRSGFLLGAVVAATDAVAAGSIAKTLGLAPRVTAVLEGESLVNDATGLLALELGVALLLDSKPPTIGGSLLRLLWLVVGGLAVGLAVGWLATLVERWIDDGPLEMAVSLIVPYVAYLAADELRASGVLAVVACGLYLSQRSAEFLSAPARLEIMSAWKALDFMLNGVVFLLIGLQLPYILAGIRQYSNWTLLWYGLGFSAILIALRMVWVFPGSQVSFWIRRRIQGQSAPAPDKRSVFVVGWAGMRGVLALAAAFSLPVTLADGRPFEQRNLILFLTFSIILVTLVVQGLSLPVLIRRLGLAGNREVEEEETAARRKVLHKTIATLEQGLVAAHAQAAGGHEAVRDEASGGEAAENDAGGDDVHDLEDLLHRYRHRLEATAHPKDDEETSARHARRLELMRDAVAVERKTLLRLREDGTIGDEVLRRLERELDLTETRYETREG